MSSDALLQRLVAAEKARLDAGGFERTFFPCIRSCASTPCMLCVCSHMRTVYAVGVLAHVVHVQQCCDEGVCTVHTGMGENWQDFALRFGQDVRSLFHPLALPNARMCVARRNGGVVSSAEKQKPALVQGCPIMLICSVAAGRAASNLARTAKSLHGIVLPCASLVCSLARAHTHTHARTHVNVHIRANTHTHTRASRKHTRTHNTAHAYTTCSHTYTQQGK